MILMKDVFIFFLSPGIKRPSMNKSMHVFSELILRKTIIPNVYLLRRLMNSGRETANYFGFPVLQGFKVGEKGKERKPHSAEATERIGESDGSYKMIRA